MSAPTEALGLVPNWDRRPGERYDIRPHGSEACARRERRHGRKPCPACLTAENGPTSTGPPCGPCPPLYCRSHLRRLAMRDPHIHAEKTPMPGFGHAATRDLIVRGHRRWSPTCPRRSAPGAGSAARSR